MPNHVTHKIIFDATIADKVFNTVRINGHFDFNSLVPAPLCVYLGDLGAQDDEDFKINWSTWNRANWGTKWNCYDDSCTVEGDKAIIKFDTAWSVPYPVIAAFANKFQIPFEHRYFDEGHNYWGIEIWDVYGDEERKRAFRKIKSYKKPEDERALCIELKGYDPDREDEEEPSTIGAV